MKLELLIEKNGMLVLFVIVCVNKVLFVFGGLINRIFFGIWVLILENLWGFFKNLIILISFCFFLFVLVIFLKWIFFFLLLYNFVLFFLKFIIWLLLFWVWFNKKKNKMKMMINGMIEVKNVI